MSKVFIHIPKNAGMTMRSKLNQGALNGKFKPVSKKMIPKNYKTAMEDIMRSIGDHAGIEHARICDLHTSNNIFFAIVRNPWSRVASRFLFAKQEMSYGKIPESYADVSSFENFLEERHKWGNQPYMWHRAVRGWYNQKDYVYVNGKLKADILRCEHLNNEVNRYFGIDVELKSRNVTNEKIKVPYKTLYNNRTIQIIADWHKDDIDTWGFDFDTSATKNFYFEERK